MSIIEEAMKDYLRNNIWKSLQNLAKNSLDYINLFKSLTNKQTCFQSLYLINDLLFFYEITNILKLAEKKSLAFEGQLNYLNENILENFNNFRNYFQKQITSNISKNLQYSFTQFSMQIFSHLNIIDFLIESHMTELACFEYFIIPKFSLELPKNLIKSSVVDLINENLKSCSKDLDEIDNYSGNSSYFQNYFKQNIADIKISLLAMNYKISYGYEIVNKIESGLIYETSYKTMIFLMRNLTSFSGVALRGALGTGKKTTFQTICIILAKPFFFIGIIYSYCISISHQFILKFIYRLLIFLIF